MVSPLITAYAQDESPFPSATEQTDGGAADDAAATSEASAPTIIVTRAACKELVTHVPDDDVAYKPGVDVRGNAVAPADLNGGSNILNSLPKEIEFPVTIDFFKYSGITVPDGVSGEQNVGKITYRNGRVYFNDQPLGDDANNAELIDACRKAGFR
ncbi:MULTISPECIES: hypothetical protein [unclassified Thalassospira]|uniref:hypothetical protein n=1 Tax=unclassified Thalassospira TaxID=2648997 RepID=UPI00209047C3|nr:MULTISPECIES: hypothetical protein [unclassified Thalassospira]